MRKYLVFYDSIIEMNQTKIIKKTPSHLFNPRLTNNTGNAGTVLVEIVLP